MICGLNEGAANVHTAWYIPDEWIAAGDAAPQSIFEAARIASKAASSSQGRLLPYSKIPRIVHQTARFSRMDTWNPSILPWIEKWLQYSMSPDQDQSMAYFFWDDEGIEQLVTELNEALLDDMLSIFTPVERADIFRILVCQRFGGIVRDFPVVLPLKGELSLLKHADSRSTPTLTPNPCVIQQRGFLRRTLCNGRTIRTAKYMVANCLTNHRHPTPTIDQFICSGALRQTWTPTLTRTGEWAIPFRYNSLSGRWRPAGATRSSLNSYAIWRAIFARRNRTRGIPS